jgi:hypothetical protein
MGRELARHAAAAAAAKAAAVAKATAAAAGSSSSSSIQMVQVGTGFGVKKHPYIWKVHFLRPQNQKRLNISKRPCCRLLGWGGGCNENTQEASTKYTHTLALTDAQNVQIFH